MSKVKIGFSGLTVPLQIVRSRIITTSMTGNANYSTPSPTLAAVIAATNALETAYEESRGRDKDKIAIMRIRRIELLFLIVQLASYVQQASEGDEEKILSSGFDVRANNTPHPDTAGLVTNIQLSDGLVQGNIKIEWDKADDAVIYIVEVSLTVGFENAEASGCTTRTQKELGTFQSGSTVWVRVFALGRENAGSKPAPVSILVR